MKTVSGGWGGLIVRSYLGWFWGGWAGWCRWVKHGPAGSRGVGVVKFFFSRRISHFRTKHHTKVQPSSSKRLEIILCLNLGTDDTHPCRIIVVDGIFDSVVDKNNFTIMSVSVQEQFYFRSRLQKVSAF